MRYIPILSFIASNAVFLHSASVPHCPQRSALSVLLFYCGTPHCCLVLSVPMDLQLFQYLTAYASLLTVHCCAYCRRYSPIGSHSLEPALIPLWTPDTKD